MIPTIAMEKSKSKGPKLSAIIQEEGNESEMVEITTNDQIVILKPTRYIKNLYKSLNLDLYSDSDCTFVTRTDLNRLIKTVREGDTEYSLEQLSLIRTLTQHAGQKDLEDSSTEGKENGTTSILFCNEKVDLHLDLIYHDFTIRYLSDDFSSNLISNDELERGLNLGVLSKSFHTLEDLQFIQNLVNRMITSLQDNENAEKLKKLNEEVVEKEIRRRSVKEEIKK